MEEQSHKSEMRAALRGDFERLRARRGNDEAAACARTGSDGQPAEPSLVVLEPVRRSWFARRRGSR